MSREEQRVQFRASEELVEQADFLARVLGTDRTEVLTDPLATVPGCYLDPTPYLRGTGSDVAVARFRPRHNR